MLLSFRHRQEYCAPIETILHQKLQNNRSFDHQVMFALHGFETDDPRAFERTVSPHSSQYVEPCSLRKLLWHATVTHVTWGAHRSAFWHSLRLWIYRLRKHEHRWGLATRRAPDRIANSCPDRIFTISFSLLYPEPRTSPTTVSPGSARRTRVVVHESSKTRIAVD